MEYRDHAKAESIETLAKYMDFSTQSLKYGQALDALAVACAQPTGANILCRALTDSELVRTRAGESTFVKLEESEINDRDCENAILWVIIAVGPDFQSPCEPGDYMLAPFTSSVPVAGRLGASNVATFMERSTLEILPRDKVELFCQDALRERASHEAAKASAEFERKILF